MNALENKFFRNASEVNWLRVMQRVKNWDVAYTPRVADDKISFALAEDEDAPLTTRLLTCWEHHCQQSIEAGQPADLQSVADRTEQGVGARGAALGGNPFFDLFLAFALCGASSRATEYYIQTFASYLCEKAKKLRPRDDYDLKNKFFPEWWNPFFCHLIGIKQSNRGALEAFRGYCGLKKWLRVTLGRFLLNEEKARNVRKKREKPFSAFSSSSSDSNDGNDGENWNASLETDSIAASYSASRGICLPSECWERTLKPRFIAALRVANAELDARQRTRLMLCYSKNITNNQVAALFGESPSAASRSRMQAESIFRKALLQAIASDNELREYRDEFLRTLSPNVAFELLTFFASNDVGFDDKETV